MTKTHGSTDPTRLTSVTEVEMSDDFAIVVADGDGTINWARYVDLDGSSLFDIDLRGEGTSPPNSPCATCHRATAPWNDRVSVERVCGTCDRVQFHASDAPNEGPHVFKGEKIFVPQSVLQRNYFLTQGGAFSARGVAWLARLQLGGPVGLIPESVADFRHCLQRVVAYANNIATASPKLAGIDPNTDEGLQEASKALRSSPDDPAHPAIAASIKAAYVVERLADVSNDDDSAAQLAMAGWSAGVNWALLKFKLHFEEAAHRGNSLEQLRWLECEWERNSSNPSEEYWQELLLSRPFALAQLLSAPVVVHGERYYVGGIRAGGKHGKIADFLLRNQLTDAAVIVEIKTPTAPLLAKTEYRQDVYPVTPEVSGAMLQVLEQRAQFMKNMQALQSELEVDVPRVEVIEPHCIVLIGNTNQLDTRSRKRSFETFRTELRNVRIVTFDELFSRIHALTLLLGGSGTA